MTLITAYGAHPTIDSTAAIERAVEACAPTGGRVVVPPGRFRTGAIRLRSNVELHLSAGATLEFVPDPTAYPIVRTRWQGIECFTHSPLIYAYGEENVAVTGPGTLDGGATTENWWARTKPVEDWQRLLQLVADGVPVEDRVFTMQPDQLAPGFRPSFIQPYACQGVRIEDVRIIRAPMWVIHPVLCSNVLVRSVTVDSQGPNNDGCNPDSCRDVHIADCTFATGDDCIAIKSGRDADGRRVGRACENILIENCRFTTGHGALTIGSETSGGIRDLTARDLRTTGSTLDHAFRIKSNSHRGGTLENLLVENLTVESTTGAAVLIDLRHADETITGDHHPTLQNLTITGLTAHQSPRLLEVRDAPSSPIENLTVSSTTSFRRTARQTGI
ncbi:glycoside hydrolase family 28 protein [Kribbella endophytica]